ncbi:MAG TPA: hypothetical protein VHO25_01840 [Polyangiaceae bacterium]|nr:hypothetical protein [Polyangiaceae bacterium]
MRNAAWLGLMFFGVVACGGEATSNVARGGTSGANTGSGSAGLTGATAGNVGADAGSVATGNGGAGGSAIDMPEAGPPNSTSGLTNTCARGEVLGLSCDGVCRAATHAELECQACESNCTGATPYCRQAVCISCDQVSPQLIACSGECVDLGGDPKNCGECGNVCPTATPYCENGACITCEEGVSYQLVTCDGQCVGSDNYNCGSCGNACDVEGTFCVQRECVPCEALQGWSHCPGIGCLEMGTIRNCSGCGDQCADGEICVMGQCEVPDFGP